MDEIISTSKLSIQQKSEQENTFIEEVILSFNNFDTFNITNKEDLEYMVNKLNSLVD